MKGIVSDLKRSILELKITQAKPKVRIGLVTHKYCKSITSKIHAGDKDLGISAWLAYNAASYRRDTKRKDARTRETGKGRTEQSQLELEYYGLATIH